MNQTYYFFIGAHNSGATELIDAFELMGFFVYKGISELNLMNMKQICYHLNIDNPEKCLYQVFQGSPFNHLTYYKGYVEKYPNSKFILTVRDSEDWYLAFFESAKSLKSVKHLSHIYNCDVLDPKNKEAIINKYEMRNKEIIEFFSDKKEKLLIIDLDENKKHWNKLLDFCFKGLKSLDFPTNKPVRKKLTLKFKPRSSD